MPVRTLLGLALLLQVPALLLLGRATDIGTFYLVGALYTLFYGAVMPLVPAQAAVNFGGKAIGAIFGAINVAYIIGTIIGPLAAGALFDISGNYLGFFTAAAVALALAALLSLRLRRTPKEAPSP